MSLYRRNIGGAREWAASTWADLQALCGGSSPARVGDRCWFAGTCYLTRRVVTTVDGDKTRWVPEDPRWGKNDMANTEAITGTVDDEGIWTLTTASVALIAGQLDHSYDCLAIVFDCSGGDIVISAMPPDEKPHYLAFRCVYRATTGGANSASISVDGLGLGTTTSDTGTLPSGAAHGQFVAIASGGAGGGGGDLAPS